MKQEPKSLRDWLEDAETPEVEAFLDSLSPNAMAALPWLFDFWALPHQREPDGVWRCWMILGGRGAGKTRAGSEWVRAQIEGSRPQSKGRCERIALIAETLDQAREVMVFGDSGILACTPPDRRPKWVSGRRTLVWPNGAEATCFSASEPESLRGPQFDGAWCDELAKWKKGSETWDMLQFGLRLGYSPRVLVTTTPRSVDFVAKIRKAADTVVTHAPTEANRDNLAPGFIDAVRASYEGSWLGRQELDGEFVESVDGALFPHELIEKARGTTPKIFDRIVVSVDPPATHHAGSDSCGIIVAGVIYDGEVNDWRAYVLADLTIKAASPEGWARAAVAAYHEYEASAIVAEVNQGGDMVESIIRQFDPHLKVEKVRATKGKSARAEPAAALYAQGRVTHCGVFKALEDQMVLMTTQGFQGSKSPDRVDALVWALDALILSRAKVIGMPRMRGL